MKYFYKPYKYIRYKGIYNSKCDDVYSYGIHSQKYFHLKNNFEKTGCIIRFFLSLLSRKICGSHVSILVEIKAEVVFFYFLFIY